MADISQRERIITTFLKNSLHFSVIDGQRFVSSSRFFFLAVSKPILLLASSSVSFIDSEAAN